MLLVNVRSVFYLQKLADVTEDPNMSKYDFTTRRIGLNYSTGGTDELVTEYYHVIQSQATSKFIRSSKSGKVSLSANWLKCETWVKIQPENETGN